MFKDTLRANGKHVHLSDLKKHVACCLTFGFNAFKMPLILPQGGLQPFFNIDVKIMEISFFHI